MKTLAEVKLILQNTGFPWHVVALEEVGGSAQVVTCGNLGGVPIRATFLLIGAILWASCPGPWLSHCFRGLVCP